MSDTRFLVITATPYKKNYKTRFLDSYFYSADKNNLFYLYITDTSPDEGSFNSCYKLTDKMMLKHFFSRKVDGSVIFNSNKVFDNSITSKKRNFNPLLKKIVRRLLWRNERWFSKSLNDWLSSVKPDIILLVWHDDIFLSKIAKKISEELNVPLFVSINDDYLFCKNRSKKLLRYAHELFRKEDTKLFYISDSMKERYDYEFGKNGFVMPPSSEANIKQPEYNLPLKSICYFGSVLLGRINTLMYFAREVQSLGITIDIYTYSKLSKKTIDKISKQQNIFLKKTVPYKDIEQTTSKYDAVILAEELKKRKNIKQVEYSLTTKIADSLSNAKIKIFIGNSKTGLINFALKNKCGFIITENDSPCSVINSINQKSINIIQEKIKKIYYDKFYSQSISNQFLRIAKASDNKKPVS